MKVYKLNGLEIYTIAFNRNDAVLIFLANKMGVTAKNVSETDIEPNRDGLGRVFRSLEELSNFEIEY